jgi:hypothetical protein
MRTTWRWCRTGVSRWANSFEGEVCGDWPLGVQGAIVQTKRPDTYSSSCHRTLCGMADSPEELALELSRAALESQDGSENQLREKATAVLSAASIVVPVAAVALGSAPAGAVVPFGVAALAYLWCARSCGSALFPKNRQAGLLGSEMLQLATEAGADLPQMQASAAS